jgi:hypothetical protein
VAVNFYLSPDWHERPTFAGIRGAWAACFLLACIVLPSVSGVIAEHNQCEVSTKGWQYHQHLFLRTRAGGTEPLSRCKGEWRWKNLDGSNGFISQWLDDTECEDAPLDTHWHQDNGGHYGYSVSGQFVFNVMFDCWTPCEFRLVPQNVS